VDSFVFGVPRWRANRLVLDVKATYQAKSWSETATVPPAATCNASSHRARLWRTLKLGVSEFRMQRVGSEIASA
jgi:hypothetical protein